MSRHSIPQTIAVGTTSILTNPIRFTDQAFGEIILPTAAAASITTLTWYVSDEENGTYVIAADVGTDGAVTVQHSRSYRIPIELAGAAFLKPVGNAAGSILVNVKS